MRNDVAWDNRRLRNVQQTKQRQKRGEIIAEGLVKMKWWIGTEKLEVIKENLDRIMKW